MGDDQAQHDEVGSANREDPMFIGLICHGIGVVNPEDEDGAHDLHLDQTLWMVNKGGVLHLVKRVGLSLPLFVEHELLDGAHQASLHESHCI